MTQNSDLRPNIFEYYNLNDLIRDYISYLVKVRNLSYRSISAKCKINSSGYIQNNVIKKKCITIIFLKKFIKAFVSDPAEVKYIYSLFFMEHSIDSKRKGALVDQLLQISKKSAIKAIDDKSIYSHWIYGIIIESLNIRDIDTRNKVVNRLSKLIDRETILSGIKFLIGKGYIKEEGAKLLLADTFDFKIFNDKQRSIEIQQNHSFFLTMARSRLIDDLNVREFQGLTVAIKAENLIHIKKILRDSITEIREKYSDDPAADGVYRVQISAFKLC